MSVRRRPALLGLLRPRGRSDPSLRQGLFGLVRILLMFESVQYSAITPILPHYAQLLGASTTQIGVLAAAYAAGIIPGSLLAGTMAGRAGVRRTTVLGLLVFAAATAAFGFGGTYLSLVVLRVIQGVACGLIWGGALTWVIAVAPRERRGELIGSVIGAAIVGTLIGPVVGTAAVSVGTGLTFSVVGLVSAALAGRAYGFAEPPPANSTGAPTSRPHGNRTLWLGAWLILLAAGLFGGVNALIPLRLSRFGASNLAIGATFFLAATASALLAPALGRLTDRRGAAPSVCGGLAAAAVLLAALPLPHSALPCALLVILATGPPVTAWTIPAASWMTDSAEQIGISLTTGTMLFNLAYAVGETVGAPATAALAQATGDAVPLFGFAAMMVFSLLAVLVAGVHRTARPVAG